MLEIVVMNKINLFRFSLGIHRKPVAELLAATSIVQLYSPITSVALSSGTCSAPSRELVNFLSSLETRRMPQ